jgi:hypothetical protein
MAVISKVFTRAAAATGNTTLYTTTAGSSAVITNILATNTSSSAATFTINFNGVAAFSAVPVDGNSTATVDLKQVLTSGQTITGSASTTAVNFHISGVEIV